MKVYSIIQARGGSKGVPGKNIRALGGYPLIAYSIAASQLSKRIKRTIVSTDSEEIADCSKQFGGEVPFLRPAEFAQDKSTDLDVFQHAIRWLKENEKEMPDFLVQFRPTTPLRDPLDIDRAIELIQTKSEATSLRSAHELPEPPQKMLQVDKNGFFQGFFPDDPRPEYYNLPRQMFPRAYHPNGYVDIIRPGFVEKNKALLGPKVLSFITPVITEVDLPEDFDYLEYQLTQKRNPVYEYLTKKYSKRS